MDKHEDILTVKETAERLGYGLTSIYDLFKAGELRGYRKGRKGIRIFASSIDEYVERRMNRPPASDPAVKSGPEAAPMPKVRRPAAPRKGLRFEDKVVLRVA